MLYDNFFFCNLYFEPIVLFSDISFEIVDGRVEIVILLQGGVIFALFEIGALGVGVELNQSFNFCFLVCVGTGTEQV